MKVFRLWLHQANQGIAAGAGNASIARYQGIERFMICRIFDIAQVLSVNKGFLSSCYSKKAASFEAAAHRSG